MQNETYIQSLAFLPFKNTGTLRVIIAGGGTGGHIFPAVAIAKALVKQDPKIEILFVGAAGKMEMEKIPQAGFKIVGLYIAGYNRNSILKNLTLPFKLARSFYQVTKILKSFRPDAVIGVGGYSSFPVLRLAQTRKIPTFIHESNSFAGKSNIMLSKRAAKIFVASYGMEKFFPYAKILMTGNPVRNIFSGPQKSRASSLEFFGLKEHLKTVLVIGGSLGAQSINDAINKNIQFFKDNNLQLIWQTGKDFASKAAAIEEEHNNLWTGAFITDMDTAYSAADFVISRAGAMIIAELCIVAKPVIFVPYPFAAEDHQTANANALVKNDAALLVSDKQLHTMLIPVLDKLVHDPAMADRLKVNISKFANTNSDELIATEVLNSLHV